MSEKGTFMIATLVDWNNADQLEKTWKKISKIYKKKLKGKNPKKNQLNTFVVTEVELDKLPSRLDRIKVEQEVNILLKEYADSIHDAHYEYVKRQGTISRIYEKGLKSQGREDLFLKYTESKAQKFEKIESDEVYPRDDVVELKTHRIPLGINFFDPFRTCYKHQGY